MCNEVTNQTQLGGLPRLKRISSGFNELHEQFSVIREHVTGLQDPEALKLLEAMEFGCLAPMMRRLRLHLNIPYNWHEDQFPRIGGE